MEPSAGPRRNAEAMCTGSRLRSCAGSSRAASSASDASSSTTDTAASRSSASAPHSGRYGRSRSGPPCGRGPAPSSADGTAGPGCRRGAGRTARWRPALPLLDQFVVGAGLLLDSGCRSATGSSGSRARSSEAYTRSGGTWAAESSPCRSMNSGWPTPRRDERSGPKHTVG